MPATPPPSSPAAADPHTGHQMSAPADAPDAKHVTSSPMLTMASARRRPEQRNPSAAPCRQPPSLIAPWIKSMALARWVRARDVLANEHGGEPISKVMANIFEYAAADEGGGYRWEP